MNEPNDRAESAPAGDPAAAPSKPPAGEGVPPQPAAQPAAPPAAESAAAPPPTAADAGDGGPAEPPAGPPAETPTGSPRESTTAPTSGDAGDGAAPGGDRPAGKRRRGRRSKGKGPGQSDILPARGGGWSGAHGRDAGDRGDRGGRQHGGRGDHHALSAIRSLSLLADSLLRVEGVDPFGRPRSMDLHIRVPLDDDRSLRSAASAAVEQILLRVREVREHERALRPGSVYSYFHGSADAEGCRPSEPRQVFDGYHSTGRPVFSDFVTMAIERKDPGIEQLLAGDDVVLTHVSLGRVLRTQQLAEWGQHSPVYRILGQVDAGLFRLLSAEGRCAYSFQLLRGTTLEGRPRLRLQSVGAADLMDLADPSVLHTLSRFQRRLDEESLRLSGKAQNGGVDEEEFVLPLLQELAQKLSSRHRRQSRRTQHAVERSEEGQRPTTRAYPDAGEAADDRIWWDTEKNTIVLLGPKGRVHVFTPQGKHVTSVMMPGAAVHKRQQQGRWRPAEPEERGEFRIQLKKLVQGGTLPEPATPEAEV